MRPVLPFALALYLPAAAVFAQQHAHEHGVAELRVVVDGKRLGIELETPLDNLVGFEHAPGNAQQRQALQAAEATLRRFDALFALPAGAGCVLKEADIESPFPSPGDAAHGHDAGDGHTEMHADYQLDCANPKALTEIRVNLPGAFPRMQRIHAETATPKGQGATTLDTSRRVLPL